MPFSIETISLVQFLDGLKTHFESFIQLYFREDFVVTQDTIPARSINSHRHRLKISSSTHQGRFHVAGVAMPLQYTRTEIVSQSLCTRRQSSQTRNNSQVCGTKFALRLLKVATTLVRDRQKVVDDPQITRKSIVILMDFHCEPFSS